MHCPICLKNVNPVYRKQERVWDLWNINRHLKKLHPGIIKKIEKADGSDENEPLIQKEDFSVISKDSIMPSPASTNVARADGSDENVPLIEKEDLSVIKEDSIKPSTASANGTDKGAELTTKKSKREKRPEITSHESEPDKRKRGKSPKRDCITSDSTSSSSSWLSESETDGIDTGAELTQRKSKREKCPQITSHESERNKRKRGKSAKRDSTPSDSTSSSSSWSSESETDGIDKGSELTPNKSKLEKRPKISRTSHESECNKRKSGKTPKRTRPTKQRKQRKELPEWRKPGVKYSWVKFSVRGRCYPGFIFPQPNKEKNQKNEKRLAQYITLKGDVSDIKHPVEIIVNYKDVPMKVKQQYVKAFEIFNEEYDCNYK